MPLLLFVTSPLWQPAVAAFLAPRGDFSQNQALGGDTPSQQFVMDSVDIVLTSNGKEEWRINSEQARTGANDREIFMEVVEARYIGKDRPPKKGNGLYRTARLL